MASSTIRAFASKAKSFLDIPINWGKSPAQNNPEVNKAVTKVLEDAAEILVEKAPDGMTANVK